MALTEFQRDVCRLLAENRIRSGDSYVAGGAALNELLASPRRSRDIDPFHDTQVALFKGNAEALRQALDDGALDYHEGRIGGAFPRIVGS